MIDRAPDIARELGVLSSSFNGWLRLFGAVAKRPSRFGPLGGDSSGHHEGQRSAGIYSMPMRGICWRANAPVFQWRAVRDDHESLISEIIHGWGRSSARR
jgi:hypothetical protein